VRLALLGKGGGPGIFEIMAAIGKEESMARIQKASEIFKNRN